MIKLGTDEHIVGVVRKHWILPLVHTITLGGLFLLPILVLFVLLNISIPVGTSEITLADHPSYIVFALTLWALMLWLSFFTFWTDHHLDGWVITNKRIIDVEQKGFFQRDVASFRLERLQDVTTEVHGIVATILKYGEVHVQTAGAEREFVLRYAPDPKTVKQMILDQHDTILERRYGGEVNVDGVSGNI